MLVSSESLHEVFPLSELITMTIGVSFMITSLGIGVLGSFCCWEEVSFEPD